MSAPVAARPQRLRAVRIRRGPDARPHSGQSRRPSPSCVRAGEVVPAPRPHGHHTPEPAPAAGATKPARPARAMAAPATASASRAWRMTAAPTSPTVQAAMIRARSIRTLDQRHQAASLGSRPGGPGACRLGGRRCGNPGPTGVLLGQFRGVRSGCAFDWGSKGRRFESAHPDSVLRDVASGAPWAADPRKVPDHDRGQADHGANRSRQHGGRCW